MEEGMWEKYLMISVLWSMRRLMHGGIGGIRESDGGIKLVGCL